MMTLTATKIDKLKKDLDRCEGALSRAGFEMSECVRDRNDAEDALEKALEQEEKNNV